MTDTPAFAQAQWALDTIIATGSWSTGIAITSDGSKLVVTNYTNPGSVKIISTSDYAITSVDVSSIDNYPNGVTITPDDSTALVNTAHNVIFIDLKNATIKGHFAAPCVATSLYGIAVMPNGQTAVLPDLSSGCTLEGLRLIDATGRTSGSTFIEVNTSGELYGIAITPDNTSAIVTTYSLDSPKKVNLATSDVQNISGMSGSYGVAALHLTNEALIFDGDSLDRVSLATNSVTKKISNLSDNSNFQNIAITKNDQYAFVMGDFEKLVVSLTNDSVIQTFTAGGTNVATTSDGSRFFVTDSYDSTVRVYKKVVATGIDKIRKEIPSVLSLSQNYPNPFNPTTTISFDLPSRSFVSLKVFDLLGREVSTIVSGELQAGTYTRQWNAANMSSGIYFYRLVAKAIPSGQAGTFIETKKLLLLK